MVPLLHMCQASHGGVLPNGSLKDVEEARQILSTLHTHGVDWTDPSAWPEDCVDGTWRRQFPIPFLLEHVDSDTSSSMTLLVALCRGTGSYYLLAASAAARAPHLIRRWLSRMPDAFASSDPSCIGDIIGLLRPHVAVASFGAFRCV